MAQKTEKKKRYSLRSKVYKGMGMSTIALTTIGGFLGYEAMIDYNNFHEEMQDFTLITTEGAKLNIGVALPMLVGTLVFLFVMIKKNKEFFKDKISLNLLITLTVLYLIYSVIELTMFALMGALVGSLIDEFGFSLLAKSNKQKALDNKEYDMEEKKEKRRIMARKAAQEELDGSV